MAKAKHNSTKVEATEPSPLLQELLAREVSSEMLLAVGPYRDDGVLAQLSRYELQELVPETEGLQMDKDLLLRLARFKVERARLVKLDATQERLDKFDQTAREWTTRIFNNHAASQAAKASAKQAATPAKAAQPAQRRATTMNDAPVTEQKAAKKATKKAAKKETAVEKKAAAPAGRKTDNSVYETMVVATNKESREGSFFDRVTKLAKNPIKLETLIGKVGKEVQLRSDKDADTVIRVRVRDAFSRLGYLKAAKS